MIQENISDFYDDFSERQLKIGANDRLLLLFEKLIQLGLKEHSSLLELGCGVGLFTRLISKKIKSGNIEAVDLSPKSIEIAKRNLTKPNVIFAVGDVVKYQPKHKNFDFITLLDVIEHIPLDQHGDLFKNLEQLMTEKTQMLINIPNPQYISYLKIHSPETLQVIDQSVELFPLMQHLEASNLEIIFFKKYGIWEREDYHMMVIRKKREFSLKHLHEEKNLFQKIKYRLSKKWKKLKYEF